MLKKILECVSGFIKDNDFTITKQDKKIGIVIDTEKNKTKNLQSDSEYEKIKKLTYNK